MMEAEQRYALLETRCDAAEAKAAEASSGVKIAVADTVAANATLAQEAAAARRLTRGGGAEEAARV